jgi:hypothetical protein
VASVSNVDSPAIDRPLVSAWSMEWVGAMLLPALALRLVSPKMGDDLWYDEAFSYAVAKRPFFEMVRVLHTGGDTNPPLYTLLLHFWLKLGDSDWWIKGLSLTCGMLTVLMLYALGRRIAGPMVGLMAALLFVVSGWGVYYSIEARPYALFFVLSLGSTHAFMSLLRLNEGGRTRAPYLYITLTVAAVATHWFGVLLAPVHMAGVWIYKAAPKTRGLFARCLVAVALLSSPLVPFGWNQFRVQAAAGGFGWPGAPDLPYVLDLALFLAGGSVPLSLAGGVLATALACRWWRRPERDIHGMGASARRKARQHALFMAAYLLIPLGLVYAASSVRDDYSFFVFRYFLAFAFGAFVLLGMALRALPRPVAVVAGGILLIWPVCHQVRDGGEPSNAYRRAARETWPGDEVGAVRLHLSPMSYYSVRRYRLGDSPVRDRILWHSGHGMSYLLDYNVKGDLIPPHHLIDLRRGLADYQTLWVVLDEIYPSRRALALWEALHSSQDLERVWSGRLGTVVLERYRRIPPGARARVAPTGT